MLNVKFCSSGVKKEKRVPSSKLLEWDTMCMMCSALITRVRVSCTTARRKKGMGLETKIIYAKVATTACTGEVLHFWHLLQKMLCVRWRAGGRRQSTDRPPRAPIFSVIIYGSAQRVLFISPLIMHRYSYVYFITEHIQQSLCECML